MERHFFVKRKVGDILGTKAWPFGILGHTTCKKSTDWDVIQYRAINFNIGPIRNCISNGVNIGTTGPTEKLEVSGNIKLTGRIRQGSMGDVAEMMALSPLVIDSLKAGLQHDVVAQFIGQDSNGLINQATTEYAMPQPNDVVMIEGLRRRRDNDICN